MLRVPVNKNANAEGWYYGFFSLLSNSKLSAVVPDETMTYTYYRKVKGNHEQVSIGTMVSLKSGSYMVVFQIANAETAASILTEGQISFRVEPEEVNNYQLSQAIVGLYTILGGDPAYYASLEAPVSVRGTLFYEKLRTEIQQVQATAMQLQKEVVELRKPIEPVSQTQEESVSVPQSQEDHVTQTEPKEPESVPQSQEDHVAQTEPKEPVSKNAYASQLGAIGLMTKEINEMVSSLAESFNSYLDNFDTMNQTVLEQMPKLSQIDDLKTHITTLTNQEQKQNNARSAEDQEYILKLEIELGEVKQALKLKEREEHKDHKEHKEHKDLKLQATVDALTEENKSLIEENDALIQVVRKTEQQRDKVAKDYRDYVEYIKENFNVVP